MKFVRNTLGEGKLGQNDKKFMDELLEARNQILQKFDEERLKGRLIDFPMEQRDSKYLEDDLIIPNFAEMLRK